MGADPAAEDTLYESAVLSRFVSVDLGRAPAPDETTILNFRHLLEEHQPSLDRHILPSTPILSSTHPSRSTPTSLSCFSAK